MATNPKHRTRAASQGPVFSRLQNLFPPNTSQPPPSHALRPRLAPEKIAVSPQSKPVHHTRKAFKVRILTWNMHDSVPKGDLEELFGKVPLWSSNAAGPDVAGSIPVFPLEADHPYHLVVVAGQECPSLSGIPMGLGAGFKLIDKDRDRDRDKDPSHRDRDKEYDKPRLKHMSLSLSREGREKDKDKEEETPEPPSGWTSMIEDWLCQGSGSGAVGVRSGTGSPTVADVGSPKPLSSRPSMKEKEVKKGPYQLLIKERMMGIYLAVYVHREVRGLVRGTSRSAVTAGLIGGRVGNKGGVGITMNLDGTTFLFLNAHLAAHEGRVNHRLSNLAKIKAELSVDDWLAPDDPRVMAEDLTDKFDYAFLCGDLNFRLDISRLHADWLMSRKDYAQALAFDQLTNLMTRGEAFFGFREAPINFPPTFKYDVLRTLKRAKRRGSKMDRLRRPGERSHRLTEVEEKELEQLEKEEAAKNEDEEGEEAEAASMASSNWTSAHSRVTERERDRDRDLEDEEYYTGPGHTQTNVSASTSKVSLAVHAAKTKWRSLLPSKHKAKAKPHATRSSVEVLNGPLTPFLTSDGAQSQSLDRPLDRLRPPPMIYASDTKSKSSLPSDDDNDSQLSEEEEKGVYDSSHKKRVPSWCDRILWKTTVEPEPEPDPEDDNDEASGREALVRPRATRINQFFVNAFRPLSARVRKDSWASMATSTTSGELEDTEKDEQTLEPRPSSSPEHNVLGAARPFSRFVQAPGSALPSSPLAQVKSHEHPLPARSPVRGHTHPELGLRRTSSANSSTPASGEHPRHTMRRATASAATSDAHAPPNRSVAPQLPPLPYTVAQAPTHSRWRFLPSFFSHTSTQSSSSLEPPASAEPAPPPPPRRGDVVCLRYDTLDDRGMRRLEGRSDHRPVIGSYAVYL